MGEAQTSPALDDTTLAVKGIMDVRASGARIQRRHDGDVPPARAAGMHRED